MERKFCSTHHLYYTSQLCPCCVADTSEALSKRFYTQPIKVEEPIESKPNYEEALAALVNKYAK